MEYTSVEILVHLVRHAPAHYAGLVPMTYLRPICWDIPFDRAVAEARRAGLLTATALEGRHGVSLADRDAAIAEDGLLLGFLSLRS